MPEAERKAVDAQSDEMRRLKAELKRVMEERDILKKPRQVQPVKATLGQVYHPIQDALFLTLYSPAATHSRLIQRRQSGLPARPLRQ